MKNQLKFILGTVLGGVLALSVIAGAAAQAGPYGGTALPTGVESVTVGGGVLNLNTSPAVASNLPSISGKVSKTSGTVVISIEPNITLTASVGPDGSFSAQVAAGLSPGSHKVFIDGALVGSFTVGGTPAPPATGTGTETGPLRGANLYRTITVTGLLAAVTTSLLLYARKRSNS